jgi:hypothetical protein
MMSKPKYSYSLNDWVMSQVPDSILEEMSRWGWNAFGIYETIKEGIKLEKNGKLPVEPEEPQDENNQG